jgi:glycerophosphoryl diester phosphodiesterase
MPGSDSNVAFYTVSKSKSSRKYNLVVALDLNAETRRGGGNTERAFLNLRASALNTRSRSTYSCRGSNATSYSTEAPRILVHGHRGARARRPENTLPAFEYAIAQGVDALEMDMAVTKDNVIVISHDPTLEPPVCTGPQSSAVIRQLTLAEVRQWDCGAAPNPHFPAQQAIPGTRMPTLDDVFQLAPRGAFDYNLETKSFPDRPEFTPPPEEFARMVLQKIRQYQLEKRIILQSFDFRTLAAMRKLAPEIRL